MVGMAGQVLRFIVMVDGVSVAGRLGPGSLVVIFWYWIAAHSYPLILRCVSGGEHWQVMAVMSTGWRLRQGLRWVWRQRKGIRFIFSK